MKPSEYQLKKIQELKEKALTLYKTGLSTRDIAKVIKRSHTWVADSVRELSTVKALQ